MDDRAERPAWSDETADALVGKRVLVGLTYQRADGDLVEHVQLHGAITRVDPRHGIGIERAGSGELFWLPPDLRAFHDAAAGDYRLRSTGEVVVDPDLLTTWTINMPPDRESADWRETLRAGYEPPEND